MFCKNRGFSLPELMIVIVIIGILVGIAVPIYLNATGNARKGAAEAKLLAGEADLDAIWFGYKSEQPPKTQYWEDGLMESGIHYSQAVSRHNKKNNYLTLHLTSSPTDTLSPSYKFKDNTLLEGGSYDRNPNRADDSTCIVRGYLNSSNQWVKDYPPLSPSSCLYITVVAKVSGSNKCFFTTYKQGKVHDSGSFEFDTTSSGMKTKNFEG